ncbi:MAG: thiosulfate/3-mercaptopyruvate sulfurtransferase [Clostridium sp.]
MIKGNFKKVYVILMLLILVTVVSACSNNKGKSNASNQNEEFDITAYKNNDFLITSQEVNKLMGSENLVLLDCNKPDIYEKGHIKGALGIGIQGFSSVDGKIGDANWGTILKPEELKAKLESLGIDNEKTIVFYSDVFNGPGADGRAVWQLKMAGFNNVKMLVGGLTYWKELGNDVTDEASLKPTPTTGVVIKDYDKSYAATKDYVYSNLGKQVIIDVRSEGEFKGSQKAGEPRGGHIEGAINLVWTDLLNKNGTPKSPKEINDLMASVGVKPQDDFVVY